ncbi:dynamin family protein [Viridibacillus sp. YIM B01967]|uniref:Dynamin family protein n=1 Tax=Viridibacillus soli TaxID=2798301 RepID=A0ABS1H6A0_9BACL|nr:dynamin family protein [Viridibacillus soli]MBK3494947.1 dynamin family protein [Viridibacillus soli]
MTVFEQQLQQLLKQTAMQYLIYKENADEERLQKTTLFANKLLNKEYMIGFAGHFSAGKSSMINALTGDQLLPSSPIPTSANVVKVHKSEQDYAIAYLTGQEPVKFDGDYDIKTVKAFAKNGALVSQIEIGHSKSVLPVGVTVMDTPGVDSTDDAHRMSTESALHLADIVFYVMDYNHVQSELNFQFTKQLMKFNPNVYLIVNQIDKHKDNELDFTDFEQSVHTSFANWGVVPKGIFFTSLRELEHPRNNFQTVKGIVMSSMDGWQEQLIATAKKTLQQLNKEHEEYLQVTKQEIFDTNEETLPFADWENRQELKEQFANIKRQLELYSVVKWKESFEQQRQELLENAGIMPYELRDKLKLYLESMQQDFKVGVFFSAKKTVAEKELRKEELYKLYQLIITSQISGHMLTMMKKSLKDVGALTDDLSLEIDKIEFDVPFETIQDQVKKDALATGDALLNFANRVSEATKRWFTRTTDEWKDDKATFIEQLSFGSVEPLKKKEAMLSEKVDVIKEIEHVEEQEQFYVKKAAASTSVLNKDADNYVASWTKEHSEAFAKIRLFDPSMLEQEEDSSIEETQNEEVQNGITVQTTTAVHHAIRTANAVANVQGFKEVSNYLKNKVERLEKKDFTIALFGAFSAGKSSFSNALMGQQVLPVSPNPTTATINKIRPVSPDHPHETADVQLKTASQLQTDIIASYEAIGVRVASLDEAFIKADEALQMELVDERLHVHKSFVRAFVQGYEEFKDQLGETLRTNRDDFEKFVAEEKRSCFVDSIDFYFDCELTRMGVTLVDTPGADSINARHTGVAFDYIRNADAILFITYYNHAFARADREFLIQLGRVKDAFELDKMFFIVNAIDLAANKEEEHDVKKYVQQELQRFGIRKPRLFGVSSLLALKEKVEKNEYQSGMPPFEEAFDHFLSEELSALAVQALVEETEKTQNRLASLIKQTEDNMKRKDERLAELTKLEQFVHTRFEKSAAAVIKKDVEQELAELMYYVLQRVYYRFPDFYNEAYNPATFTGKSSSLALQIALKEVLQSLSFDFEQEMRVTNFRVAQFIHKKVTERYIEDVRKLKDVNASFSFTPFEAEEPAILEFTGPFEQPAPYESVKSHFKNSKSFFEKGDRVKLRDALEQLTKPDAENYLNTATKRMNNWSDTVISTEAESLRHHLSVQATEQIATERELLQEESKLAEWKKIYASLFEGAVK